MQFTVDCTCTTSCEVKGADGKCHASILGYCPYQNVTPDDAVKVNMDRAGEVQELRDA